MSSLHTTEQKRNLVFYFQVHQPRRLKTMRFFDIGSDATDFDDELNKSIMERIARECYLPTNSLLLKLIKKHPNIKVAFSISGVTLEQFEEYAPEVLDSFKALAETGSVEFLAETYYHSLACMIPGHEFEVQILKHQEAIQKYFGVHPTVFRNTELIYNDDIGKRISTLGFKGVFTDGVQKILGDRAPHQVYSHPTESDLKILLRNYLLSDDIAFRFTQNGTPLTVEKYMEWLNDVPAHERVINLAMDYETFGEHHKKDSGIFNFFEKLLVTLAASKSFEMALPTEVITLQPAHSALSVPQFVSWADQERDLSAWLGNDMQRDAFDTLIKLEHEVKSMMNSAILKQWRCLQTSDHLYYMSTKKGSDGNVHNYFSPYPSPYEAFINFMNVLTDFTGKVSAKKTVLPVRKRRTASALKVKLQRPILEEVLA